MKALRLGIVGCGRWAQKYVEAATARDDVELVGYSRREKYHAPAMADLELLALDDLFRQSDAVLAAAGPESHGLVMHYGFVRAKHVFVEKPAALRAHDVRKLLYRRLDLGAAPALMIGHTHLYADGFRALCAEVYRRRSKVREIWAVDVGRGPVRSYSGLRDYGPHPLAMIFELLGLDVAMHVSRVEEAGGNHVAHLVVGDGIRARLEVGNCAPERRRTFGVELESGQRLSFDADHVGQATVGLLLAEFVVRARNWKPCERDLLRELRILETLEAIEGYQPF